MQLQRIRLTLALQDGNEDCEKNALCFIEKASLKYDEEERSDPEIVDLIVQCGCLPQIVIFLGNVKPKLVRVALESMKNILKFGDKGQVSPHYSVVEDAIQKLQVI